MSVWYLIILNPILNFLLVLSNVLSNNFGLAIVALTIIVRAAMFPLTMKQLRASKVMQQLGPKMQELRLKYGKDQVRLNQEMAKVYKESGMSPAGCAVPMLIQFPIWIALYQAINHAITSTPEKLISLHGHLYSGAIVHQIVPLGEKFLWLNLGQPDSYYILPIIVGVTMWVQQKMVMHPVTDPQQQQQNKFLLWGMPVMWVFMTIQFPSGLALYWFVSNIITIVIQYFVTGWGELAELGKSKKKTKKKLASITPPLIDEGKQEIAHTQTEGLTDGKLRNERQERQRSYRTRSGTTRSRTGRSRDHSRSRK